MTNLLEDITRASIRLLLKEPFFGHFFATITREISDKTPTLGVSTGENNLIKLSINEQFWKEILTTNSFRYGVLKHEILHIVFKHILIIDQFRFKDLANIAMDMVVNQYIDHEQLPLSPILIENYPALNLELNQDASYYYKQLLPTYRGASSVAIIQLKNDLEQINKAVGSHQLWGSLDPIQQKIIESNIDETIKNSVRRIQNSGSYHHLPAGLKAYFEAIIQRAVPFISWKRVLRLFATTSQRTFIKSTIRRPSKRYGTTPGIKVKHKNKLLVAIDTSGSVSNNELAVFFGEIHHIFRQGAEIMIVECDTQIHKRYLYRGKVPSFITGRGGTDFNAPIQFANEKYQPDAIIYFTDGYAAAPYRKPRAPILWLITSGGIDKKSWDNFPGRKVKMIKKTAVNV